MWKKIGYIVFGLFFKLFRLAPVQKNKVFMVATHDDSEEGNIGIVSEALAHSMPQIKRYDLTRRDGIRHPFLFFFGKAYHLATAGTVFLDNTFMPMAYTPFSKKVKVVQLWHGTGTIKRFGQDTDTGEVARLAKKANARLTHLIVNSDKTKRQYAGAFAVPEEKIHILGLPRTDLLLDGGRLDEKRRAFYERYPKLQGKRCILYAPTFRDDETETPGLALELDELTASLRDDEVLLLRLHPHVAEKFSMNLDKYHGKVKDMSGFSGVTTLLAVSDCLITDYSSIIFEYCLLGRPMIFYAYDLDTFAAKGRSFYEDYESFVPGPVVKQQKKLEEVLAVREQYADRSLAFAGEQFAYLDQNAVNRLLELIFEKK